MAKTRAGIIRSARELRASIEQIFIDCASWNEHSTARKGGAESIDPDPDGRLRRIADGLDVMLAKEAPPVKRRLRHGH